MKRPELKWIEVEGWNYSAFPRGTLPSAKDLAGLTGGRPAFLVAYDYHTIWMNREALREFGITRATRKVIFAEHVEKDPKTDEPTGILTGSAAQDFPQMRRQSYASTCRRIRPRRLRVTCRTIWQQRCGRASQPWSIRSHI